MPKVPSPTTTPLLAPDGEEEQKTDRLLAQDRNRLSSFVRNLNDGVSFDEMDDDLKAWWMSRY